MYEWFIDNLIDGVSMSPKQKGGLTFSYRFIALVILIAIYFTVRHYNQVSEENHQLLVVISQRDSIRDVRISALITYQMNSEEFHKQDLAEHTVISSKLSSVDGDVDYLYGFVGANRNSVK